MRRAETPAPLGTASVHVTLTLAPVSTPPPFGAVTATCGLSRPVSQMMALFRMSLRIDDGSEAGSIVLHSKYIVSSRDVEPPHVPAPGVPSAPLRSQRTPHL